MATEREDPSVDIDVCEGIVREVMTHVALQCMAQGVSLNHVLSALKAIVDVTVNKTLADPVWTDDNRREFMRSVHIWQELFEVQFDEAMAALGIRFDEAMGDDAP